MADLNIMLWMQHVSWDEKFGKFLNDVLEHVPEAEHEKLTTEAIRLRRLAYLFLEFSAADEGFSWEKAADYGWLAPYDWTLFKEELRNVSPLRYYKAKGIPLDRVHKSSLREAKELGFEWED